MMESKYVLDEGIQDTGELIELQFPGATDPNTLRATEVTLGSQIANNTLVVRRLLQFLDWEDLLNCRLVSPLWNDEVVTTFLENKDLYPYDGWSDRYRSFEFDLDDYGYQRETEEMLTDFCLLLEESKHPQFLVDKAHIYYGDRLKVSTRAVLQCQEILQIFGSYIKKLDIKVDGETDLLSRCLGQKGYCPNLQQLCLKYRYKSDPPFTELNVQYMGILKLKKLEIHDYSINKSIQNILELFKVILDHSPFISNLSISNVSVRPFLQVLQSKNEITMRLTKFSLEMFDKYENFSNICLLKFGPNLKRIKLIQQRTSKCEFGAHPDSHTEAFNKFFKMVSHSLESLEVYFHCLKECISMDDIPIMPKLKNLLFDQWQHPQPMNLNFMKKLPALRTMKIYIKDHPSIHKLLETTWRENLRPSVPREIHGRLESICIYEQIIYCPKTIEYLNVAFPYLSRLEIKLQLPISMKAEQQNKWFHQCFFFISQMNNLKDLSINFNNWKCHEFGNDLKKPFSILKNTPILREITLWEQREEFKANLIGVALPALMGAPRLRLIQFHCDKVNINTKMVNDFAEMKINLKLSGIWNCCQNHQWLREGMVGDAISPGNSCLVHQRMREVEVEFLTIERPETLQHLNVAFPNLSELEVYVRPPAGISLEETQSWFEQAFLFISQMQRLTNFTISFRYWECNEFNVDLKKAFIILKETPNLLKMTFWKWEENVDEDEHFRKANSIVDSFPALIGATNIRRICLFRAPWGGQVDEKLEKRIFQLQTDFADSQIFLHVDLQKADQCNY